MSLKDTLARKKQRETHYDVVVADPTEAEEAYEEAFRAFRRAELEHGEESPEASATRAIKEEARAALAACVERIYFRNLPSDEFEELVGEHKPTKEQQEQGQQWNDKTFAPALLAACAVDSDMTEKEWIDELASDRWSQADVTSIFMAALSANVTPRSVTVPKG